MTHRDLPPLTVRGPESVPLVVPHLVGFLPERSLVLLGLVDDAGTAGVTARIDLPSGGTVAAAQRAMREACAGLLTALERVRATAVIAVVYPGDADAAWADLAGDGLPHRDLVVTLRGVLDAAGPPVRDVLCVVGDRVRSYLCHDTECCPSEGRIVDAGEALRLRAAFVERGSAPLRTRRDLVAALAPRPADDPVLRAVRRSRDGIITRLPAGTRARVDAFVADVARWGARPVSTSMTTRLVVLAGEIVADLRPRDLLLRRLTVDADRDTREAARQVLAEAVRCARPGDVAAPAAALAVCAWAAGDGAAARVAVDRALADDPQHSLAVLVERALDEALPPGVWRAAMAGLTTEEILGEDPPGRERSPA